MGKDGAEGVGRVALLVEEGQAFDELTSPGAMPAASQGTAVRRRRHESPDPERFEVIVIGGGQAGLSVGYHLARRGLRFVILDAHRRIGDSWRQRWDSLRLFTPARWDGLDGMRFPAPPRSFPTKDQMAGYLESYAARFELPVRSGIRVDSLTRRGASSASPGWRACETGDPCSRMGASSTSRTSSGALGSIPGSRGSISRSMTKKASSGRSGESPSTSPASTSWGSIFFTPCPPR
jgi:hypothetical protein